MLNFTASNALKIYYCPMPVNLHRSFDGLPGLGSQDTAAAHLEKRPVI